MSEDILKEEDLFFIIRGNSNLANEYGKHGFVNMEPKAWANMKCRPKLTSNAIAVDI